MVDLKKWGESVEKKLEGLFLSVDYEGQSKNIFVSPSLVNDPQSVAEFVATQFGVKDQSAKDPLFLLDSAGKILSNSKLLKQRQRETVSLKRGVEIVHELEGGLVMSMKSGKSRAIAVDLKRIVLALRGNPFIAQELLLKGILGLVFQTIRFDLENYGEASYCDDLCADILVELFKYDVAAEAIEQTKNTSCNEELFRLLIQSAFPTTEGRASDRRPTLLTLIYLLYMFPDISAHRVQVVLSGADGRPSLLPLLLANVFADSVFANTAASAVLASAALSIKEDDAALKAFTASLFAMVEDKNARDDLMHDLMKPSFFAEQLLLVALSQSTFLSEDGYSKDEIANLENHVKSLEDDNATLKKMLRKSNSVILAMLPFLQIEGFDAAAKAVPEIVRFGWDGCTWKNGYTVLHHAAESCQDPAVVELLAALASDMNIRDDAGWTPMDYARETNTNPGVLKALAKLEAEQLSWTTAAEFSTASLRQLEKRLAKLPDLTGSDRSALEAVLRIGPKMQWPNDFSAAHLAAKRGHKEWVEWLMDAGVDANAIDAFNNTPLDYAQKEGHQDVVLLLSKMIESREKTKPTALRPASSLFVMTPAQQTVFEGLPPELRKAIRMVIDKGWTKIKWPHDFSPLHLGARLGSGDGIKLLLEASASPGLHLKDGKGMLPIDHAREKHMKQAELQLLTLMKKYPAGAVASSLAPVSCRSSQELTSLNFTPISMRGSVRTDLTKEREQVDTSELGLTELKREVKKLRDEREEWLAREKTESQDASRRFDVLDIDSIIKYVTQLDCFGREAVEAKLKDSALAGGNSLNDADAASAVALLEFVSKVVNKLPNSNMVPTPAISPAERAAPQAVGSPALVGKVVPPIGKGAPCALLQQIQVKGGSSLDQDAKSAPPCGKGAPCALLQQIQAKSDSSLDQEGKSAAPCGKGGGKGGAPPAILGTKGGGAKGGGGPATACKKGDPKDDAIGGKGTPKDKKLVVSKVKLRRINWKHSYFGINGFPDKADKDKSIWCNVSDAIDNIDQQLIEDNFAAPVGKVIPVGKATTGKATTAPVTKGSSAQEEQIIIEKVIDIITISQRDQGIDGAFKSYYKKLPPVEQLCEGIDKLDERLVTLEHMDFLLNMFKLRPHWVREIGELKAKYPHARVADQETFIWGLGTIQGYEQRMQAWNFTRTYEDCLSDGWKVLRNSDKLIDCFRNSKMMTELLGFFLAVGNFMNSQYNQASQADGFRLYDIDTAFRSAKDKDGKAILMYIIEMFMKRHPEKFKVLLEEFNPVWCAVQRTSVKRDSCESISRKLQGSFEDCQEFVKLLKSQLLVAETGTTEILSFVPDVTHPFRVRIPFALKVAKEQIEKFDKALRATMTSYEDMLRFYGMDARTAELDTLKENPRLEKFITFWDEVFISEDLILKKPARSRADYLDPIFLHGKVPTLADMECLYGLREIGGNATNRRKTACHPQKKTRPAPQSHAASPELSSSKLATTRGLKVATRRVSSHQPGTHESEPQEHKYPSVRSSQRKPPPKSKSPRR